uniref:Transposase IS30-like HTH domain-containing protein n=1 Tax=Poecilia formosa TaxID=48698 RepID=A0A096LRP3_POEFO
MARQRQLSKEKRLVIITLRNEGQSVRKIGKTLKVIPSAVKETGSHEDRPRKGRPRVTSAAEDKFIRVTSLRNRRLTAARIRDQVNATQCSSSRHISATTVKRVWGGFAGDTVGDLFKFEGILNQHGYHSILQLHAIPSGLRLVGPSSGLCKGYSTKKERDGVLRQMNHRVKAKGPTSVKHLWELLQDCWKTISGDDLLKLIKRTPRVCEAVIKAKGGYFEEPRI